MTIMWRSGVALILLIGLAALVTNLWLDDSHGPVEHMHRNAFAEGDGHSEQQVCSAARAGAAFVCVCRREPLGG